MSESSIFSRIYRGEIPSEIIAETENVFAIRDIAPKAPAHVLVIPKGPYVTYDHFCAEASDAEIVDFARACAQVCEMLGLSAADGGKGSRAITNAGEHGVQEVPHFHLHILGGRVIGRMIENA